jgi:hypothetical protein
LRRRASVSSKSSMMGSRYISLKANGGRELSNTVLPQDHHSACHADVDAALLGGAQRGWTALYNNHYYTTQRALTFTLQWYAQHFNSWAANVSFLPGSHSQ